jgi:hypothetical protein
LMPIEGRSQLLREVIPCRWRTPVSSDKPGSVQCQDDIQVGWIIGCLLAVLKRLVPASSLSIATWCFVVATIFAPIGLGRTLGG